MNKRYNPIRVATGLVIAAILIVGGIYVYNHNNKGAKTALTLDSPAAATSSSSYQKLAPATVPSKTAECHQTVTYDSNGVPSPITCPNGELNVNEWNALAALEPKVLTLGYDATSSSIQSALCSDVEANISNPIEETVYQTASLYYGWNYGSGPTVVISNGTCQNVDD